MISLALWFAGHGRDPHGFPYCLVCGSCLEGHEPNCIIRLAGYSS